MLILELYAGTRSIGTAFENNNHKVVSLDYDPQFTPHLLMNYEDFRVDTFITMFGVPDIIWASPDCTTYSIAAISTHRNMDRSGKTWYAQYCDKLNYKLIKDIEQFKQINPNLLFFIENPMGTYRKMPFVQTLTRHTVTYCQYGDKRMKPTDIFTNHPNPNFKPMCKNGDSCHTSAPRGSKTGTQGMKKIDKSKIPTELCEHIVRISEDYFNNK